VIIIEPELEFDEAEPAEAPTSIGGGLSLLAGSVAPCEKAPPKNRKLATTAAKHRNLNSPLNVLSSHKFSRILTPYRVCLQYIPS